MRRVVLDTETTGLNAGLGDRIIELGCIEILNRRVTDNSFQLLNNGGDNRIIVQNGPFTFATPVNINGQYNLSVISGPSTQGQGCTLWNYKGTATANVTNIIVDCAHDD